MIALSRKRSLETSIAVDRRGLESSCSFKETANVGVSASWETDEACRHRTDIGGCSEVRATRWTYRAVELFVPSSPLDGDRKGGSFRSFDRVQSLFSSFIRRCRRFHSVDVSILQFRRANDRR